MGFWGDFQGLNEATGGGRGVKKFENWGDVVYGWSLSDKRILRLDMSNSPTKKTLQQNTANSGKM